MPSKELFVEVGVKAKQWFPGDLKLNKEHNIEECGPVGQRYGRCPKSWTKAVIDPGDWIVEISSGKSIQISIMSDADFRRKYKTSE